MKKQCLTKPIWKSAIGANPKAKRLKLKADNNGLFSCPVYCYEHRKYHSKRGCRKHIYAKHGWQYYFEKKPEMDKDFPSLNTRNSTYKLPQRSKTSNMAMFLELVKLDVTLNHGYKLMEEGKWRFRLNKHCVKF